jgi:hypothetical protein
MRGGGCYLSYAPYGASAGSSAVVQSAGQFSIFLNCDPSCWGNPEQFIGDLFNSSNTYGIQMEFSNLYFDCEGSSLNRLATHDFDGNGYSDIAFLNQSGGLAVWLLLKGYVNYQSQVIAPLTPNGQWLMMPPEGSFLGGQSSEILWQNFINGNLVLWGTDGAQLTDNFLIGTAAAGWTVAGSGDFDGDVRSDILFTEASGDVVIWFMNGTQISWSARVGTRAAGWSSPRPRRLISQ